MYVHIEYDWLNQTCGPVIPDIRSGKYRALRAQVADPSFNRGAMYFVGSVATDDHAPESDEELDKAAAALALLCESVRQTEGGV